MAEKRLNWDLVKLNRLAAWLPLAAMITYICSGFALCGELGLDRLIGSERALALHRRLVWPLVTLFVLHSAIGIYFALRRWGWIRTRAKS